MNTDFTPKPATEAQRETIRRLCREAEFDSRTVTTQHRLLGVAEHEIGRSVDEWLVGLTKDRASVVITKLKKIVD